MTEHRPTVTEVVSKLQTYGSADQLAAFFEQEGVRGDRSFAASCPVANYVHRETGTHVAVSAFGVRSGLADWVRLDEGSPTARFIPRFDEGAYPALERT